MTYYIIYRGSKIVRIETDSSLATKKMLEWQEKAREKKLWRESQSITMKIHIQVEDE